MRYISICEVSCDFFFCFKQMTAYELRITDWSSDVCSSDLNDRRPMFDAAAVGPVDRLADAEPDQSRADRRHDRHAPFGYVGFGGIDEAHGSLGARSEARRVGEECDSTGRSRW